MTESTSSSSDGGITVYEGWYGDQIDGTEVGEVIVGGRGRDDLFGHGGNDTLDGGPSYDNLSGGPGRDTFLLGNDSGIDRVSDSYDDSSSEPDLILLKPGVSLDDVTVIRLGDTLFEVRILDSGASISISRPEPVAPDEVFLKAADGRTMTYGQIANLPYDYSHDPELREIRAQGPGTTVSGTAGSETLISEYPGTTFDLGPGNDCIFGGAGSTLLFDRNSGQDRFVTYGFEFGEVLTVKLGADVKPSDLVFYGHEWTPRIRIAGSLAELQLWDGSLFEDGTGSEALRLVFADGTVWRNADIVARLTTSPFANLLLRGGEGSDLLQGGDGDDYIEGEDGDDTLVGGLGLDGLSGEEGNDLLQGGDQSDQLFGGAGNDTLDGGAGFDDLTGGEGQDTYLFGRGSQDDSILYGDGEDVIRVRAGLSREDVHISLHEYNGYAVELAINGTGDRIVFNAPLADTAIASWEIDHIEFVDGGTLSRNDIAAELIKATQGDDVLMGMTTAVANRLDGLAGDDMLYAGGGDDTLEGSIGQDTLDGGEGNDTFIFRRGDGADLITDAPWVYQEGQFQPDPEHDVLQLPDFRPEDIQRVGTDRWGGSVVIQFKDGDSVTLGSQLTYWEPYENYTQVYTGGVNEIRFADGTSWGREEIKSHISGVGTDESEMLYGQSDRPNQLQGLAGDDTIYGGMLADTLDGGEGIDELSGGAGDDLYIVDGRMDAESGAVVADQVYEFDESSEGIDLVVTGLSTYDLPSNVENLIMTGKGQSPSVQPSMLTMLGKDGTHAMGNELSNRISGSAGADLLEGLDGDDVLQGMFGNDTLDGGWGLDTLEGGAGDDTYVLNDGSFTLDGQAVDVDTIVEWGDGQDMVQTSIDGFCLPDLVENLQTSATTGSGNALDNRLSGGDMANWLMGLGGNDTLEGGGGDDTLAGGEGNDLLVSASDSSNDTVEWGRGQGADRLQDAGGQDTLKVLPGVSRDQLWLRKSGSDLEILVVGTNDRMRIEQWYGPEGVSHRVERIELADGQALEGAHVQRLVDAMAGFSPPALGQTNLPQGTPQSLKTAIAANWA